MANSVILREWVQTGEDEGVPIYSEVEMSETNDPDYRWRPATRGDIGSIARFADFEYGGFSYGILTRISDGVGYTPDGDEIEALAYHCDLKDRSEVFKHDNEQFVFCWIQYDANKEP